MKFVYINVIATRHSYDKYSTHFTLHSISNMTRLVYYYIYCILLYILYIIILYIIYIIHGKHHVDSSHFICSHTPLIVLNYSLVMAILFPASVGIIVKI